jgi:hypothetical protein
LVNPQGAEKPTEEMSWRARIATSMTKRRVKASRSSIIAVSRTNSDMMVMMTMMRMVMMVVMMMRMMVMIVMQKSEYDEDDG